MLGTEEERVMERGNGKVYKTCLLHLPTSAPVSPSSCCHCTPIPDIHKINLRHTKLVLSHSRLGIDRLHYLCPVVLLLALQESFLLSLPSPLQDSPRQQPQAPQQVSPGSYPNILIPGQGPLTQARRD